MINFENYKSITSVLDSKISLVAVSKTKPLEDIISLYNAGQRIFGENRALEMKEKADNAPKDIQWHFIGHLQTNKIKYIIQHVSLIHSIDSYFLLKEIDKQSAKLNINTHVLLQFHIAIEETKFGFNIKECEDMLNSTEFKKLKNITIEGVMGMATLTGNDELIRKEFKKLNNIFNYLKTSFFNSSPDFKEISMGMSYDYKIAIEEGSTMLRIGSALFGERKKNNFI